MKFLEIKKIVQPEIITEEVTLRVSSIKTGFNKVLPPGTNYVDSHVALPVFSSRWGRGVLVKSNNGLDAIIGNYGGTHAQLKKGMQPSEMSAGTFYYGFDSKTKILYLEYGSDRTFDFNDGKFLNAIMNALKLSPGPLKGFVIQKV